MNPKNCRMVSAVCNCRKSWEFRNEIIGLKKYTKTFEKINAFNFLFDIFFHFILFHSFLVDANLFNSALHCADLLVVNVVGGMG